MSTYHLHVNIAVIFIKNRLINIHCNQTILSSSYDSAISSHCSFVEITQLLKKCIFHLKKIGGELLVHKEIERLKKHKFYIFFMQTECKKIIMVEDS